VKAMGRVVGVQKLLRPFSFSLPTVLASKGVGSRGRRLTSLGNLKVKTSNGNGIKTNLLLSPRRRATTDVKKSPSLLLGRFQRRIKDLVLYKRRVWIVVPCIGVGDGIGFAINGKM